jgi:probable rRNA maturation factor
VIILESKVAGLSAESLGRFVLLARRAVPLPAKVNILVTSQDEMRRLNLRFRKKNKTTDVLSFPADSFSNRARRGALAGEIAISADVAARSAARLGHSPAMEVKILALHGILHLAGFDHERDNGEMAHKESHLRRKLGLPSSLTERGEPVKAKPRRSPGRSRLKTARRMG